MLSLSRIILIIAILNSDDVYFDNSVIEKVVHAFENSQSDAVYGDLFYVDATNLQVVKRYWKSGKYVESSFLWGWMPPHPAFFVTKECYQKFGLFNFIFINKSQHQFVICCRF